MRGARSGSGRRCPRRQTFSLREGPVSSREALGSILNTPGQRPTGGPALGRFTSRRPWGGSGSALAYSNPLTIKYSR